MCDVDLGRYPGGRSVLCDPYGGLAGGHNSPRTSGGQRDTQLQLSQSCVATATYVLSYGN